MTKEKIMRIHRVYSVVLSIVIVIAGICLAAACVSIYHSGDQPFNREIVSETFRSISLPVYLCLALSIGGFILEFFLPVQQQKEKGQKPYAQMLKRMQQRKDLEQCDKETLDAILSLRKNRKLHTVSRTVILLLSCAVFLPYALNGNNFHQPDINSSMIHAMYRLLPCLVIVFIYAVFTAYHNDRSIQKELDLMKSIPVREFTAESAPDLSGGKKLLISRYILLAAGLILLIYGFISGGTADVLTKAINICTECIGLG